MHAVSAHQRAHPTKHHNNCVHDAFGEGVTSTIHVVDLDFVTQSIMFLAVKSNSTSGRRTQTQVRGALWIWQSLVLGGRGLQLCTPVHPKGRLSAILNELVRSVRTWHRKHVLHTTKNTGSLSPHAKRRSQKLGKRRMEKNCSKSPDTMCVPHKTTSRCSK